MQQDLHPSLCQQNIAATALLMQEKPATRQIFKAILEKNGNATDVFKV